MAEDQNKEERKAADDVMEAYKSIQRVKEKIGFNGTPPALWEEMCRVGRSLLELGPKVRDEERRRL